MFIDEAALKARLRDAYRDRHDNAWWLNLCRERFQPVYAAIAALNRCVRELYGPETGVELRVMEALDSEALCVLRVRHTPNHGGSGNDLTISEKAIQWHRPYKSELTYTTPDAPESRKFLIALEEHILDLFQDVQPRRRAG